MRRRFWLVLVVLAMVPVMARADLLLRLGSPILPPSPAAPSQIGTLQASNPILTYAGSVDNPTPLPLVNDPIPVVCAVWCWEYSFNAASTLPFLASLHSTGGPDVPFNPNDGFVLYVYGPDNMLVGAANGIGADGQAIAVDHPATGTYTLVVSFTYEQDPDAGFKGEVRLMSGETWQPGHCTNAVVGDVHGCFELPELQALPAYDLAVTGLPPVASTPLGFPLPVSAATPTSCYLDETLGITSTTPSVDGLQHPITRCLRFTSNVRNVGAGTLEVRLPWLTTTGTSGFLPGQCQASQVVTAVNGDQASRPAGPCEFHLIHAHFHYKDLVSYALYKTDGTKIGVSTKESFCLADDEYFGFATAGPNGARGFVGQPGCNIPAQANEDGIYVAEGVTPGWGDVYTWDTPGQFIDISNTPPGTYDLVMETNPSGALLVSGAQQTCAVTRLELTADSVRSISTQASIPCPS